MVDTQKGNRAYMDDMGSLMTSGTMNDVYAGYDPAEGKKTNTPEGLARAWKI